MTKQPDRAEGILEQDTQGKGEGRAGSSARRWACLLSMACLWGWGCALPQGGCKEDSGCAEGSHCVKQNDIGLCVWGKADTENPGKTVPDIRLEAEEAGAGLPLTTAKATLPLRIDVYGATQGIDTWFGAAEGEPEALACAKQETGRPEAQHQRLVCKPTAKEEGRYVVEVEARAAKESRASKAFEWKYEKKVLDAEVLFGPAPHGANTWGRDDTVHVQLHNVGEGTELFWGERRLLRQACQGLGFFPWPNTVCFVLPLSEAEDLPHGPYVLRLRADSTDKDGNHATTGEKAFDIRINRQLWELEMKMSWLFENGPPGVVTHNGLLVVLEQRGEGDSAEDWLVGIEADGRKKWEQKVPGAAKGLMLGNHQSWDVVVVDYSSQSSGPGLYAVHASTGKLLIEGHTTGRSSEAGLALLQGGNDEDLVVVRKSWSDSVYARVLEACRFNLTWRYGAEWSVNCEDSGALPAANIYTDGLRVRQTPEGTVRVYVGSNERHWCAVEWTEDGWAQNSGSTGSTVCVEEGPEATVQMTSAQITLLGFEHLWSSYYLPPGYPIRAFGPSVDSASFVEAGLFLVDANDELIGGKWTENLLQRFSAKGELLHERESWIDESFRAEQILALMEGGKIAFAEGDTEVSCLKSDFKNCWERQEVAEDMRVNQLLGVLPLSSTRSIVVFNYPNSGFVRAFVFDSPGLKKDAPWPIFGSDLCRTNNVSVPVDNCLGKAPGEGVKLMTM